MFGKCRLWKSDYDEDWAERRLGEIDQKHSNYTHVKIDATILNKSAEQLKIKL